jgi:hypothetical protein
MREELLFYFIQCYPSLLKLELTTCFTLPQCSENIQQISKFLNHNILFGPFRVSNHILEMIQISVTKMHYINFADDRFLVKTSSALVNASCTFLDNVSIFFSTNRTSSCSTKISSTFLRRFALKKRLRFQLHIFQHQTSFQISHNQLSSVDFIDVAKP